VRLHEGSLFGNSPWCDFSRAHKDSVHQGLLTVVNLAVGWPNTVAAADRVGWARGWPERKIAWCCSHSIQCSCRRCNYWGHQCDVVGL